MKYHIAVHGLRIEYLESYGGWQEVYASFDIVEATKIRDEYINELGEDNVDYNF